MHPDALHRSNSLANSANDSAVHTIYLSYQSRLCKSFWLNDVRCNFSCPRRRFLCEARWIWHCGNEAFPLSPFFHFPGKPIHQLFFGFECEPRVFLFLAYWGLLVVLQMALSHRWKLVDIPELFNYQGNARALKFPLELKAVVPKTMRLFIMSTDYYWKLCCFSMFFHKKLGFDAKPVANPYQTRSKHLQTLGIPNDTPGICTNPGYSKPVPNPYFTRTNPY